MLLDQILNLLKRESVPVFGTGPAARMADEPAGFRPDDLLPGTKSLISFGIPVPRGVYHTPSFKEETIWRSQNLYYRRLDGLSLEVAALLENNGERALPTFGCMPLRLDHKGNVVGYLNQIRMGEITGIGITGKNGLLLNSKYGSRLMLGGVLTTASLPSYHFPEIDEPGCPPDCHICEQICPVHAIIGNEKKVRIMRCLSYTSQTHAMSRIKFGILRAIDPKAAGRYMSLTAFDENTFHICSGCVEQCPYGDSE